MVNLNDIRSTLVSEIAKGEELPCHVRAFCAWILSDDRALREPVGEASALAGQMLSPAHLAALGYGAASDLLRSEECDKLREGIAHLSGRTFFAQGRPPRFEVDGIALLGVSLGIMKDKEDSDAEWPKELLKQSATRVSDDPWQSGLVKAARLLVGESDLPIEPADLAVALSVKNIGTCEADDLVQGWTLTARLAKHDCGPPRNAVRLAVFDHVLSRQAQINIAGARREDLIRLLQNVSRSMRLWTYEMKRRTTKSTIAKWDIENEYHVQNLLWTVLAPVFHDLEEEENFPSIGHKNPRADLCIPSLKTIVEIKFMRRSGQAACASIIEEIAADVSLYLSRSVAYDNVVVFVWDDCAQTEQHHELRSGLEAIKGVSAAVILPRPSTMERP